MPRGIRIYQFLANPRMHRRNLSDDDDDDGDNLNPSLLVIGLIIIGVFLVSAIIHFLLRYITQLCKSTHINHNEQDDVNHAAMEETHQTSSSSSRRVVPQEDVNQNQNQNQKLIESLPLFSFESVTGLKSSASADCAVCLSKFERHDQLRLLPICCHAFHSDCIDMWLSSNTTCPLCRSEVNIAKSEDYMKLFGDSSFRSGNGGNDSFRIEIGSVSRRRISPLEEEETDDDDDPQPRSYSMGSFEYVVDDDESAQVVVEQQQQQQLIHGAKDEVLVPATNRSNNPPPPGSEIAGEVGEGRGWLRDYIDKLAYSSSSSLSRSFRFSGRFFTGSNRQSEGLSISGRRSIDIAAGSDSRGGSWDLEGNRHGEEISNFFRWLSGV